MLNCLSQRKLNGFLSTAGDYVGLPSTHVPGTLTDYAVVWTMFEKFNAQGAPNPPELALRHGLWKEANHRRLDFSDVKDGTTNTLLMSEKHILRGVGGDAEVGGDGSVFNGFRHWNWARIAGYGKFGTSAKPIEEFSFAPNQQEIYLHYYRFGSAHPGMVNFVFCDGSVKSLNVEISVVVIDLLARYNDGQVIPSYE